MQSQFERELLKTLKSIDGTLKRIEKSMNDEEKQHTTICNAVSHATHKCIGWGGCRNSYLLLFLSGMWQLQLLKLQQTV